MLYNKSMVVRKRAPLDNARYFLDKLNPYRLPIKVIGLFEEKFLTCERNRQPLTVLSNVAAYIGKMVSYDEKHEYRGIRTAARTIIDEKGHCIEQNTALYAIAAQLLPNYHAAFTWLATKNPKGYDNNPIEEGFHPFILFKYNGKEYVVDAIDASVKEFNPEGFAIVSTRMNYREFIAWSLLYGGEDLGRHHNEPKEALNWLGVAHIIDPQNYTIDMMAGEMFDRLGDEDMARSLYLRAIRTAPNALEPYVAFADFLASYRGKDCQARKIYEIALMKETDDIQVLAQLEKTLEQFGARDLQRKNRKKLEALLTTPHFKKYFAHN